MPSSPATAPRCRRLLTAVVVATALALLSSSIAARQATLTLTSPGDRWAPVGRSVTLVLHSSGGMGELQWTASGLPGPFTITLITTNPDGSPADGSAARLTTTFATTGSYSVEVRVTDPDTGATAVQVFTWRVSDWQVGDVIVGAGDGRYQVWSPTDPTAPREVLTVNPSDPLAEYPGQTAGCAVDPRTGFLFTADFWKSVYQVDAVPSIPGEPHTHAVVAELSTQIPPRLWADWAPESVAIDAYGRVLVGHVGGDYGDDFEEPIGTDGQPLADFSGTSAMLNVVGDEVLDYNDPDQWTLWDRILGEFVSPLPPRLGAGWTHEFGDFTVNISPDGFYESHAKPTSSVMQTVPWLHANGDRIAARRQAGKDLQVWTPETDPLTGEPVVDPVTGQQRFIRTAIVDTPYQYQGTDWIDIAADQETVYFTSEYVDVQTVNIRTLALGAFPIDVDGGRKFALRLLPPGDGSGGLLVATPRHVLRLDAEGRIVYRAGLPGDRSYFSINISPDAKTFWTADQANNTVLQFDLATGAYLGVALDTGAWVEGLCVVREYTAALEPCNGRDDDNNGVTDDNCPPLAAPDVFDVSEDQLLTVPSFGVLVNDRDPDGDPLAARLVGPPPPSRADSNFWLDSGRTPGSAGSFSFTPPLDFSGAMTFHYVANEGVLDSDDTLVTINVIPVNDPPLAHGDEGFSTPEDTDLSLAVSALIANDEPGPLTDELNNETDEVSQQLSLASVSASSVAGGTVTLDVPGQQVTYHPPTDFFGTDMFDYEVCDDGVPVECGTARVAIEVTPENDAPVAADDSHTTAEDTPLTVPAPGVLGNDSDVDSAALTVTAINGMAAGVGQPVSLASGAQVTLNGDGSFTYVPAPDFTGADAFDYTVGDGAAGSTATVAITVTPVNDPPHAADDAYTTSAGTPLTIAAPGVLANDTDLDGQSLSSILATGPSHGTLVLNADGAFTYGPEATFDGIDTFTYIANDGSLDSSVATVTLTVLANRPPVCDTALALPAEIWPPNHKMVPVAINGVVDPDGTTVTLVIDGIRQDEPTNTAGDGSTAIDGAGVGTSLASVRAERTGTKKIPGNGRVYHIAFTATDPFGVSCSGEVTVGVPHDQGHGPAIDDGPLYDSTVAFPVPTGDDDHGKGGKKDDKGKGDDKGRGDDKGEDDGKGQDKGWSVGKGAHDTGESWFKSWKPSSDSPRGATWLKGRVWTVSVPGYGVDRGAGQKSGGQASGSGTAKKADEKKKPRGGER